MNDRSSLPWLSRREFLSTSLAGTAGLFAAIALPRAPRADAHGGLDAAAQKAIDESPLIYVSPLKSDGSESSCQAEVWFVSDGADVMVVTEPGRWRAAAIGKGLDKARLWVGDFGAWKSAKGRYKSAPSYVARASIEKSADVHASALASFGKKYSAEWGKWGPRFQKGLASGDRVLIRYHAPS